MFGYFIIGIVVTVFLSNTPYSENAWWITTLLWPFWFAAYPGLFIIIGTVVLMILGYYWLL